MLLSATYWPRSRLLGLCLAGKAVRGCFSLTSQAFAVASLRAFAKRM